MSVNLMGSHGPNLPGMIELIHRCAILQTQSNNVGRAKLRYILLAKGRKIGESNGIQWNPMDILTDVSFI